MKRSWTVKKLGELCTFDRGLTYKKKDEVPLSSNVVLRANNVSLEKGVLTFDELKYISDEIQIPNAKYVKEGSLLICTASGSKQHLGKTALIDRDYGFAFGGFMGMLTPTEAIESKFLYWVTRSRAYSDFVRALSDGANINNLKFSQLAEFPVPVPPVSEQKRIVAILDEAFAGIDTAIANTEKNLTNVRELFESYVRFSFTVQGAKWPKKRLSDVCANLDSRRIPITKAKRKSGDIPYYGASGVVDQVADHIFDEDLLLVSEDGANLLARTYPIAFSISGKSWVNNHAHVLQFERFESQRFIEYYLNSISLEPYVSGMAQPKLNQRSLNSIPVPFPALDAQADLVERLDDISGNKDRLFALYKRKLGALRELKQSLLHKAFSGELTSKQVKAESKEAVA